MQKKRRAMAFNELTWNEFAQKYPELLRHKLGVRLAKPVSVEQLAAEITRILKPLGRKPGKAETVGRCIATALSPRFRQISRTLDQLIENRPVELAATLDASVFDECLKLGKAISSSPKPKKTRAKKLTEEQRRRNRRASKNWYEKRKRQLLHRMEVGRIEEEFGVRKFSWTDPNAAPTGPCLDPLLKFGEVQMSGDIYCLESLFRIDRHRFPKSLPRVRRGRHIFYDIRALLKCIKAFVETGRWLPDTDRRNLVLSGIIERARYVGEPELATLLEPVLRRYMT
jgi:hypothetical protein